MGQEQTTDQNMMSADKMNDRINEVIFKHFFEAVDIRTCRGGIFYLIIWKMMFVNMLVIERNGCSLWQ